MIDGSTNFFEYTSRHSVRPYKIVSRGVQPLDALITIIITTYNRESLLHEAIDSALSQKTNYPYKILVVDNNSDPSIVSKPSFINEYADKNVTIAINTDNYGMFGNMNQGALIADTKYISFLHDDDLYSENFVEEVMTILEQSDQISSIHVGVSKVINGEKKVVELDGGLKKSPIYDVLFNGPVAPTGVVFKRSDFLKYGGYNEDYHPTADFCLAVIMAHFENYYKYNKPLCYYRVEDNDSLKSDTLALFINNDYYLLNYVLKNYHIPNFVIKGIQRFKVPSQISGLRDNFNKEFAYDFRPLGVERKGSWLWYAVCRVFVIVMIRIFSKTH